MIEETNEEGYRDRLIELEHALGIGKITVRLDQVAMKVGKAMMASRWPDVGKAIREGLDLARRTHHPTQAQWARLGTLYNVVVTIGDQQVPAAEELRQEVLRLLRQG